MFLTFRSCDDTHEKNVLLLSLQNNNNDDEKNIWKCD